VALETTGAMVDVTLSVGQRVRCDLPVGARDQRPFLAAASGFFVDSVAHESVTTNTLGSHDSGRQPALVPLEPARGAARSTTRSEWGCECDGHVRGCRASFGLPGVPFTPWCARRIGVRG
jgi:hypothetical protein